MIRLKQLRLDAGLTPEQLSEKSGVSPGTIRRLERAGKSAHVKTLVDLAAQFDEAKPSDLLRPVADFERGMTPTTSEEAA